MDTITGQGMMISKTKISTEGFEKVEITTEMAEIFGLPKKAIGKWAVVAEDDVERRLMKVRLDGYFADDNGYFADDKYNNHQRISNRIWGQMFGGVRCAKFEFSKLCTRKKNWILALIDEFEKVPELFEIMRKLSFDDIVLQIIDDTNSERPQGKAYSSIASAITYWKYKYGDNGR